MGRFQTDRSTDYSLPVANNRITGFHSHAGAGWPFVLYDYSDSVRSFMYESGNVFLSTDQIVEEAAIV